MKVMTVKKLRKMPQGTIYQRYVDLPAFSSMFEHRCFGPMFVKGEEVFDTFMCLPLGGVYAVENSSSDQFEEAYREGTSMPVKLDKWFRPDLGDGELVMVWEKADIETLIDRLKEVTQ